MTIIFSFLCAVIFPLMAQAGVNPHEKHDHLQGKEPPADLSKQMDLAYALSQGFEQERAIHIYEEVLEQEPLNQRAIAELCVLHTHMRQKDRAGQYCQMAASLNPDTYLAHDNLGLSFFKLGEPLKSLRPFLNALSLKPDDRLVVSHLAGSFVTLGEFAAAKFLLQDALTFPSLDNQTSALLHHGLYVVFLRLKEYHAALDSVWQTYRLSQNPLYLGKVVRAFLRAHQFAVFIALSALCLWFCHYFGRRMNRFLKNQ